MTRFCKQCRTPSSCSTTSHPDDWYNQYLEFFESFGINNNVTIYDRKYYPGHDHGINRPGNAKRAQKDATREVGVDIPNYATLNIPYP